MKQTLTKDQFRFQMDQIRPNCFSYEGLGVLFDYFEQYEDDTGQQIEFDPIAICCDFSQCSLREFLDAFTVDADIDELTTDEEKAEAITEYIGRNGFWYSLVEDGKEIIFENF